MFQTTKQHLYIYIYTISPHFHSLCLFAAAFTVFPVPNEMGNIPMEALGPWQEVFKWFKWTCPVILRDMASNCQGYLKLTCDLCSKAYCHCRWYSCHSFFSFMLQSVIISAKSSMFSSPFSSTLPCLRKADCWGSSWEAVEKPIKRLAIGCSWVGVG